MGWFSGLVLFVIVWWLVLFVVLPLGTRPVAAPDSRTGWRGAPDEARMGRKLLITTLVSLAIWGGCVGVIESGWVSFRSGWLAIPDDPPTSGSGPESAP